MFTEALFTIAKTWRQLKCPSAEEWIKKMQHIYTMEYLCSCLLAQSCLILSDPMDCSHQAPLSMGFFRHEYWSGLLFPSPGDFPNPGSNPCLPHCRQTLYCLSYQGSPILQYIYYILKYTLAKLSFDFFFLVTFLSFQKYNKSF